MARIYDKEASGVKRATVVEPNDIKAILAEHFKVSEDKVIKSQYSYIIVQEDEKTCEVTI